MMSILTNSATEEDMPYTNIVIEDDPSPGENPF